MGAAHMNINHDREEAGAVVGLEKLAKTLSCGPTYENRDGLLYDETEAVRRRFEDQKGR